MKDPLHRRFYWKIDFSQIWPYEYMQNFTAMFTVPSRNSHLQANDELYRIYFFLIKKSISCFRFLKGSYGYPGVPGDPQGPPGPSKTLQTMKKNMKNKKKDEQKIEKTGGPNGSPMGPQWVPNGSALSWQERALTHWFNGGKRGGYLIFVLLFFYKTKKLNK